MSSIGPGHPSYIIIHHPYERSFKREAVSPVEPMQKLNGTIARAVETPLLRSSYRLPPVSSYEAKYLSNSESEQYIKPFSVPASKQDADDDLEEPHYVVPKLPKSRDIILSIVKQILSNQPSITIGESSKKKKSVFNLKKSKKIKVIKLKNISSLENKENFFDLIYLDCLSNEFNDKYNMLKNNGILILKIKIPINLITIEKPTKGERQQFLYQTLKKVFENSKVHLSDYSVLYDLCKKLDTAHFKNPKIQHVSNYADSIYLIQVQKNENDDKATSSSILQHWTEVSKPT